MNRIQGITTISFDADGTLFDFRAVMRRSLSLALEAMKRELAGAREQLDVEALIALRDAVAAEQWAPGRTHERIREESFRRAAERMGADTLRARALATEITDLYMRHRFGDIELYPDVRPTLEALGGRYALGMTSNGNSYPDRCGLAGIFRFVVLSEAHGVRKPDPALFRIALREAGCGPEQMLHVGDSLAEDIAGAQAAGIRSAWLNRNDLANETGVEPDVEIASLAQLVPLLPGS